MAEDLDNVGIELEIGTKNLSGAERAMVQLLQNVSKGLLTTESDLNRLTGKSTKDLEKALSGIANKIDIINDKTEEFNLEKAIQDLNTLNSALDKRVKLVKELNNLEKNNIKEISRLQKEQALFNKKSLELQAKASADNYARSIELNKKELDGILSRGTQSGVLSKEEAILEIKRKQTEQSKLNKQVLEEQAKASETTFSNAKAELDLMLKRGTQAKVLSKEEQANIDKTFKKDFKELIKQEEDYYKNRYGLEKDKEAFTAKQREKELASLKSSIIERYKFEEASTKENEKRLAELKTKYRKQAEARTASGSADIASGKWEQLAQQQDVNSLKIAQAKLDIMKQQMEYNVKNKVYEQDSVQHHEARRKIAEAEVGLARATTAENAKQKEQANYALNAAKRAMGYSLLFAGIAGATASMNAAIQGLVEYDKMLYTFQAVLDVSAEKAKNLEDKMTGLSIAYGEQLSSLNKVALELGRAGTEYDKLAQGTKIVTQLAILTGDTVESSTGALVTYLQVFGKDQFGKAIASVEELGAKLAFLANSSKMNTQDINTFSNYALSTAKAVGMTIDQVNALAVALNNSGKNASTVGTNIRRFSEMLGDTNPKINEFFTSIGVNQKTLQAEIAKGGESSNKAFLGFIKTISSYSKESINVVLNGADTLMRDTILSIANSAPEITKAFSESMNVTSNEINKADLVTQTFERRVTSLVNTIISQFHAMQPALGGVVDTLTWVAENFGKITLAVSAYVVATHRAEIATVAFGVATKATATATWLLNSALMKNPLVMAASIVGGGLLYLADSMGVFNEEVKKNTLAFEDNYYASVKAIENNAKLSELQKEARKNLAFDTYTKERDKYYEEENTKKKIEQAKKDVQELEALNKQLTNANAQMTSGKNTDAWSRMIPHIQKRISELTTKIKNGGKEYTEAMNSAFGKQASSYFTEAFVKNIDEQVSLAGRLTKFEGTKALGLKMLEDLAKTIKQEANKQIPVVLQQFDNPETRALLQTQWNNLGTLSGEGYLEGVAKMMSAVQETITGLEAKIKSDKALGIDTSGLEKQVQAEKSLFGVLTNISDIKEKTLSTEIKSLKPQKETVESIYAQRDALKDTALFEQQLAQYRNGSWDTAKAQLEIAQEETKWARENLQIALSRKENEKDIAKFKRDLAEADLKEAKARNAVDKERVAQTIFENKVATERYILEQGLSDSAKAKLITLANQTAELEAQKAVADGDKQRQDIANKMKDLELEKTRAILELEKERIALLTEDGSRALDMQLSKLSNLQLMLGSMGSSNNEITKAGVDLTNVLISNKQAQIGTEQEILDLNKKYATDYEKYSLMSDEQRANSVEYQRMIKQATEDYSKVNEKSNAQQIAGYANIAGAMSSMFEQGSKEAEAFRLAQMAIVSVNAINAILSAGMAPPPMGIASMIAMGAMVAGLVSQIGVTLSAFGGSKTTTTSDAFSAMKANTGTGSVLGDSEKQSESIVKAMETLKDFAQPQYSTLVSMNQYLANISNNIGGVTSLLVRNAGFALGEGFTGSSTGYKNNLDWGNSSKGGALLLQPINSIISKIPIVGEINKMFGDIMGSVMGGLFGKTSVSQSLKDSGITFADQLLTSAIEQFNGQSYQTIATTVSKKSWFSKSSSTAIQSYFEDLNSETERQFTMVIENLYNSVLVAGEALDSAQASTAKSLENFVISLGKLSLKDKTGDEIQDIIQSAFSELGDEIARTAFPALDAFQKIGEGLFETLTRVATGMEQADFYIGSLGKNFTDVVYTDIVNKQGDIGFEALLQSIEKFDEAMYGVDNNLMLIIENIGGTAEELYKAYESLGYLRDMLQFLNLDTDAISYASIKGAGSIEALSNAMNLYFDNFLSDAEQFTFKAQQLSDEFTDLNLVMPTSREGFVDLINSLDLTSESGQELYGRLIILSEAFNETSDLSDGLAENLKSFINSFKSENLLAQDLAKDLGIGLASSYEELVLKLRALSSDKDGLTDIELGFLNTNKSYIERLLAQENDANIKLLEIDKDKNQVLLDNAKAYADEIKSSISTIESMAESLKDVIDNLRESADNTNTYTLNKFYEAMAKTQELAKGKDYKALQESLQETIGYSSALSQAQNFASNAELRFAQLSAASQFEALDLTLNTELDYLKLIEENTANTVEALKLTLDNLGLQISNSLNNNSAKFDDFAKELENATTSSSAKTVNEIYSKYDLHQYQTDSSGYAYWEQQLNTGAISVADLEKTIKQAAREKGMLSFAVGTPRVPYDMTAQIHQDEIITPATYADGIRRGDLLMGDTSSISRSFERGVSELITELKVIKEENKKMSQLLIKLTADNSRMLTIERGKL